MLINANHKGSCIESFRNAYESMKFSVNVSRGATVLGSAQSKCYSKECQQTSVVDKALLVSSDTLEIQGILAAAPRQRVGAIVVRVMPLSCSRWLLKMSQLWQMRNKTRTPKKSINHHWSSQQMCNSLQLLPLCHLWPINSHSFMESLWKPRWSLARGRHLCSAIVGDMWSFPGG